MTVTNSLPFISKGNRTTKLLSTLENTSSEHKITEPDLPSPIITVRTMQPLSPESIDRIQIDFSQENQQETKSSAVSAASESDIIQYPWENIQYPCFEQVELESVPDPSQLETWAPESHHALTNLQAIPIDIYWEENNGQGTPKPYRLKIMKDPEQNVIYMSINNWNSNPYVSFPNRVAIFASPIYEPPPGSQLNDNWYTDYLTVGNPFYCKKDSLQDTIPETPWKLIGFAERTDSYDSLSKDRELGIVSLSEDSPSWFFAAAPYTGPAFSIVPEHLSDSENSYSFNPDPFYPHLYLTGQPKDALPLEIYDIPGTTHTLSLLIDGMIQGSKNSGQTGFNIAANQMGPLSNWSRLIVSSQIPGKLNEATKFDFALDINPEDNSVCLSPENRITPMADESVDTGLTNKYMAYVADGPAEVTMAVTDPAGNVVYSESTTADSGEYVEGKWDKKMIDGSPYPHGVYLVNWRFDKTDSDLNSVSAAADDGGIYVPWQTKKFYLSNNRQRFWLPTIVGVALEDWYVVPQNINMHFGQSISYDLGVNVKNFYGTGKNPRLGELYGPTLWDQKAIPKLPNMRPGYEYCFAVTPLNTTNMIDRLNRAIVSDDWSECILIGHGNEGYWSPPTGITFGDFPKKIRDLLPIYNTPGMGPFYNPQEGFGLPSSYHEIDIVHWTSIAIALGNSMPTLERPGRAAGYNDSYTRVESHSCYSMTYEKSLMNTFLGGSTSLMQAFGIYTWPIQIHTPCTKSVAYGYRKSPSVFDTGKVAFGIHYHFTWGQATDMESPYLSNDHAVFDSARPYYEAVGRVMDQFWITPRTRRENTFDGYPHLHADHNHNGHYFHEEMVSKGWAEAEMRQ